ncbi:MAG TPA: PTS glucose transporter subunit IIA [Candidatus Treponema faecavium]|nr:PTS glucose transporter subunit IIA [Candidatus Treponema faecavium]
MAKESFGQKLMKMFGMQQPEQVAAAVELLVPVTGTVVALQDVEDEAFSSEALGKGCAIDPAVGEVYAPCDGVISVAPDTKHAVGITADNGAEVLVHVGMNTVELKGNGYEIFVTEDQRVKKGDLLLKFDIPTIKAAGLSIVTPVIVNNSDDYGTFTVVPAVGASVTHGEVLIQASK